MRRYRSFQIALGAAALLSLAPAGAWSSASRTNGLIALSSSTGGGQVFTVDITGKHVAILSGGAGGNAPAWSPDGKRIVFYTTASSGSQLWLLNAPWTRATPLTTPGAFAQIDRPTWSPDGKSIAFGGTAGPGAPLLIWTIGVNGQGLHSLTTVDETPFAVDPVWSPDGSKIAFVSSQGANGSGGTAPSGIYVMNTDGSGIHRLTPSNPAPQQEPVWSPDGKWLAFSQLDANWQTNHVANIERIGADGTGSRQLTTGGFWAGGPVISPDGTKIAFYRYKGTTVEPHTFLINSNGTGLQQLLTIQATPFSWAKR